MKNYLIRTATVLDSIDVIIKKNISVLDKIAFEITKKAAIPRVVGQFAKVLSNGIKMKKKDMQDIDKVKEKFVKLFNLYYDWISKIREKEKETKKKMPLVDYFAKVFSKQLDKFVEQLTVPEEKGGPGWKREGVNRIVEYAARASKMPAGWRGEKFRGY